MSEQDTHEGFGDLVQEEAVACYRCAQMGETCMDNAIMMTVSLTTCSSANLEDVRKYLISTYGEEYATSERIQNTLNRPVYATNDVEVCDKWYQSCEWCDEYYTQHMVSHDSTYEGRWHVDLSWIWDERLCRSCSEDSYVCDRCNTLIHSDETNTIEHDYIWCDDCRDNHAYWCDGCDTNVPNRSRCDCNRSGMIHSYSYKPSPEFQWIAEIDGDLGANFRAMRTTPFLGLELEVEFRDADGEQVVETCHESFGDRAYYKQDSSLSDGFEIVTHPMTLAAHKMLTDWSVLKRIASMGCRSWNSSTCGLHVHISRSAFQTTKHMTMFQFLILNNKQEMVQIAGRESERWSAFDGVKKSVIPNAKGLVYRNRYEAINVLNEATLEIRMFRGSLKPERVLMALELVDAAYRYTRTMTAHDYINGATQFARFAEWCAPRKEYENLNTFIATELYR